jgi:hypothetical protein
MPFNPATAIRYTIRGTRDHGPEVSDVRLVVYDLLGREVAVLVNERKEAGSYSVTFDARGLASGAYFFRLRAGDYVQTKSLLILTWSIFDWWRESLLASPEALRGGARAGQPGMDTIYEINPSSFTYDRSSIE